jgi:hypothetical protein
MTISTLPNAIHVVYQGSISSAAHPETIEYPIDPTTSEVAFTVKASSTSEASSLEVDQISLVDSAGNTVAQLGPVWNPQTGAPSDAVTIALDHAPAGGRLVLQISAPAGVAGQILAGTTSSSGVAADPLAFVIDVQRLESSAAGLTASGGVANPAGHSPVTQGSSIGTLSSTSNSGGVNPAASAASTAEPTLGYSTAVAVADAENPAPPGGDPGNAEMTGAGDFSGRIALGPLASRNAAPLGPNLATVNSDPAPSVDRYERALSQEIDEHSTGTIEEPLVRSGRHVDHEAVASRAEEARRSDETGARDRNFVAIAGLGALPLMVSASANRKASTDLEALLVAMPGATRVENGATVAGHEDSDVDPSVATLTAQASASQSDGRPAPDYLTSACVLAVGMGLTAGPLIPDLLRLLPRPSSRRRFVPVGRLVGTTGRDRGFGHWLRRRIV